MRLKWLVLSLLFLTHSATGHVQRSGARMICRLRFLLNLVVVGLSAGGALAQSNALNFTSVNGGFSDAVPRVIGWEFTVGSQPILVSNLGVYDYQQNGLQTSHAVGIYRYDNQSLVVSGTVPSGTAAPLSSFFRYTSVTPTVLDANTQYIVAAAWASNADDFVWSPSIGSPMADISGLSFDSSIQLGLTGTGLLPSARFEDTTDMLEFPSSRIGDVYPGDPRTVFVGPNFTIAPVPEPMNILIIGAVTVASIGTGQRFRHRNKAVYRM